MNVDNGNIVNLICESANLFPDKLAIEDPLGNLNYKELITNIHKYSKFFSVYNMRKGDVVLVILPNSVNYLLSYYSIIHNNSIAVPCEPTVTITNLLQIVKSCKPKFLITNNEYFAKLDNKIINLFDKIFLFGDYDEKHNIIPNIETKIFDCCNTERHVDSDINDISTIMYTTGTTGKPKGVALRNRNILAAINNICEYIGYSSATKEVVVLPLSHNFGLGHVHCNLTSGGSVYTDNGMSKIGRLIKKIKSFDATGFPNTPAGYSLLLNRYSTTLKEYFANLKFSVINSAPLPSDTTTKIKNLLPHLNIYVYYGLTEASRSTFISLTKEGPKYFNSVGKPMKNVRIDILNGNKLCGDYQKGELVIESPTISGKYWNDEELTKKTFKNGRLYTGDIGYKDKDGYIFITGRKKDIINCGGYKINPNEIENIINKFPNIETSGVIGLSNLNSIAGDSIVAAIKLSGEIVVKDLIKYCHQHLESYKIPHHIEIVDNIPLSNTGKIKREALKKLICKKL